MSHILIGTAGWSIPSRDADHFPTEGSHLVRYAARFDAVEINSSFHRPHRRATYARWADSVPDRFRFAVKIPRTITHDSRLVDIDAPLARFADEIGGLGSKLGAILIQLPPSLAFEADRAARFFAACRTTIAAPLACEPRHPSWFEEAASDLLTEYGVARVAADPARMADAAAPGGSDRLVYIRLHGSPRIYRSDYGDARLAPYAEMLRGSGVDTWCILDNTAAMAATDDALRLQRLTASG